jgi:hypothetical protein
MCTSKKDKHYFWKLVAKEVKWVNEEVNSPPFWVVWDLNIIWWITCEGKKADFAYFFTPKNCIVTSWQVDIKDLAKVNFFCYKQN